MKFHLPLWATLFASVLAEDLLFVDTNTAEEYKQAQDMGMTSKVITQSEFEAMDTESFRKFKAIIIPDPYCSSNIDYHTGYLNRSKDRWSPAIDGNMIFIGADPSWHASSRPGAVTLMRNGIKFAAAGTDPDGNPQTGCYFALGCYEHSILNSTLDMFSYFGEFVIRGQLGCYNDVHLVADSPAMDSIKDGDLSDWSCSVHEAFSSYPTTGLNSFQALAIAENVLGDGSRTFADNTTGLPYIISRGATPTHCGDNNFDKEFGEQCDDGNKEDGDGCNRSCQCEAGYKEDGKGKCFLENACPAPPDWWLSSVSAAAASATANLTTLTTTTTSDISTSTLSPSELPAELPADTPYGY